MSFRRWTFSPLDKVAAAELASACDVDCFLALLLNARGWSDPEEAAMLLAGEEEPCDPFAFADMDVAAERIQTAIDNGERIAVFGDYDADGVTATVLLYTYLKQQGANVTYRIPRREESGYGLHHNTIDDFVADGVQLLITVDNGISAVDEVAYANSLGLDVVVTDHHQPQDILPPAVAVVDPHREDCESEFKMYAGVGVAFKLVCALEGDEDWALEQFADLVALGTLADVMPLENENRRLVRAGLALINSQHRPGLVALANEAGSANRRQTSSSAVFTLAPRINAAGRMGDPDIAAQLLLAQTLADSELLAQTIAALNTERQKKELDIMTEVSAYIDAHPHVMAQRIIVLSGNNWYSGVVGIIAARILEKYGKPCILLSISDGIAKGSGRSVPGFSLFDAIASCSDILLNYGGHTLAAGLGMEADKVDEFRRRINEYAKATEPIMPVPELHMDFRLVPSQIDVAKLDLLDRLEPYGAGNPQPVFCLYNMTVESVIAVAAKHSKLTLSKDGVCLTAIRFGVSPDTLGMKTGDRIHLAVTLDRNEYRGNVSVSIIVKDLRFADTVQEDILAAFQLYDRLICDEQLSADDKQNACPSREHTVAVFRLLKEHGDRFEGSWEWLYHTLAPTVPTMKLKPAVEVLREAGVISVRDGGDIVTVQILPVEQKADLTQTTLMKRLSS